MSQALDIVAAGADAARASGNAVAISVVDDGGHLLAFQRMDGVPFGTARFSERKAATSAALGAPTAMLADAVAAVPGLMSASFDGVAFVGGGLPLRRSGELIGGIGVAGGPGDVDDRIAHAAADGLKQEN